MGLGKGWGLLCMYWGGRGVARGIKTNSRGCNGLTSDMSGSKCEILHGGT